MTRVPDAQSLISRLRLVERGRELGRMNKPPATQPGPDAVETEIASHCAQLFASERQTYVKQRRVLQDRIASSVGPKSDADPDARVEEACNAMERMVAGERHELRRLARSAQEAIDEVKKFKADHELDRPARLPENRAWSFGILVGLVVVETLVNGLFFGANLEGSLVGGLTYAVLISVINVGVFGLLATWFGRQILHCDALRRFGGLVLVAVVFAGAIAWNLAVAHYREALAPDYPPEPGAVVVQDDGILDGLASGGSAAAQTGSENCWRGNDEAAADGEAVCLLVARLFSLQGFQSYMLLLLGLAMCGAAAWEWSRMTDPYPGYGKVVSAQRDAESVVLEEERDLLDRLGDQFDEAVLQQRKAFADPTDLWKRGQEAGAELRELHDELCRFSSDLEKVCRDAVDTYRAENRGARSEPAPEAWSLPPKIGWDLPETPRPVDVGDENEARKRRWARWLRRDARVDVGDEAEAEKRSQAAKDAFQDRIQTLQERFKACELEVERVTALHHE